MNRLYLLLILMLFSFFSKATHLVGGEFELLHKTDSVYTINLNLYFDDINGNPNALDQNVTVHIFKKADDSFIVSHLIDLSNDEFIPFPAGVGNCSGLTNVIRTRKLTYSKEIILSPDEFEDEAGYYLVWERCCRNGTLDNLLDPDITGQVFYMEFPAVIKDENAFINSSPVITDQINDYACVNEAYSFNFSASDVNGDSLVYSLVTPLKGFSTIQTPVLSEPFPGPYPEVTFLNSYSPENMIHGDPGLSISDIGILDITPTETGLFAYAIKCEEYRDGVKIGEVRKEYQLLVVSCQEDEPGLSQPSLTLKNESGELYQEGDTITFEVGSVSAVMAQVSSSNQDSYLGLDLIALDYTVPAFYDSLINESDGLAEFTINVNICSPNDEVYNFMLIAYDYQCPRALNDTLMVIAKVKGLGESLPNIELEIESGINYNEGDTLIFEFDKQECVSVTVTSENQDTHLNYRLEYLDSTNSTFTNTPSNSTPNSITYELCVDFLPNQNDTVQFYLIGEEKYCFGYSVSDTLLVTARIIGFKNTPPEFDILNGFTWNEEEDAYIGEFYTGDLISFDLQITDSDIDNQYVVQVETKDFEPTDFDMTIGELSGSSPYTLPVNWQTKESDIPINSIEEEFKFIFLIGELKTGAGAGIISNHYKNVIIKLTSVIKGIDTTPKPSLTIYPNPLDFNNDLILKFSSQSILQEAVSIEILDLAGKQQLLLNTKPNVNEIKLGKEELNLKKGLYLMKIIVGNEAHVERLFVK